MHAVLLNLCKSPTAYTVSVLCHSEGLQVHLDLCAFILEHLVVAAKTGIGCYTVHDIHEKGWVLWFQRVKDRLVLPFS